MLYKLSINEHSIIDNPGDKCFILYLTQRSVNTLKWDENLGGENTNLI